MNKFTLARRLDCLEYHLNGIKPATWVPQIAAQYNTTENAVNVDWSRRTRWLPELLILHAGAARLSELIYSLERARAVAHSLMIVSTSETVRVNAAGKVASINKTLYEVGVHSGHMPSVMTEILERIEEMEKRLSKK